MANKLERKCAHCKNIIEIERGNISNVLQFQGKYYHSNCFEAMAAKKASSNRGKPEMWRNALSNKQELEIEARNALEQYCSKDDLNEYLLSQYDVTAVPGRLWQMISDLEHGEFKGKKCKPIKTDQILAMWKWGQKRLNQIAANNKTKLNGPNNENDRIRYDFTILLNHIEDYKKYVLRTKEEAAEIEKRVRDAKKFDYEKIYAQSKKENETNSILDLMNDIF